MPRKVCGAKIKTGSCGQIAMLNGRCKLHGGKTPKGIASANFKTGEHSKYAYLPPRLSEKVAAFIKDPEIVHLRENIAVMDARLTELYSMVGENESGTLWLKMQKSYEKYRNFEFLGASKAIEAAAEKVKFESLLESGMQEQVVWSEIIALTEQRRKLSETESKRIKDSQQIITSEQFMTFIQLVLSVIKENVKDKDALNNISERLIAARTVST